MISFPPRVWRSRGYNTNAGPSLPTLQALEREGGRLLTVTSGRAQDCGLPSFPGATAPLLLQVPEAEAERTPPAPGQHARRLLSSGTLAGSTGFSGTHL